MNFSIVLSTRNRLEKLKRFLCSIVDAPLGMDDVWIACDGDQETADALLRNSNPHLKVYVTKEHVGSVAARNQVLKHVPKDQAILYATDDVVFLDGALWRLRDEFQKNFPDGDGVLGITQEESHHPTGMAIVGPEFMARYPDRQLFFPGYYHFAAQEVWQYALSLDKFKKSEEVAAQHNHPCHYPEQMDQTHLDARLKVREDHRLMQERRERGDIWPAA